MPALTYQDTRTSQSLVLAGAAIIAIGLALVLLGGCIGAAIEVEVHRAAKAHRTPNYDAGIREVEVVILIGFAISAWGGLVALEGWAIRKIRVALWRKKQRQELFRSRMNAPTESPPKQNSRLAFAFALVLVSGPALGLFLMWPQGTTEIAGTSGTKSFQHARGPYLPRDQVDPAHTPAINGAWARLSLASKRSYASAVDVAIERLSIPPVLNASDPEPSDGVRTPCLPEAPTDQAYASIIDAAIERLSIPRIPKAREPNQSKGFFLPGLQECYTYTKAPHAVRATGIKPLHSMAVLRSVHEPRQPN